MWEVTLLDSGLEVGTFDFDSQPAIDTNYGDCVVVEVVSLDEESQTATVAIQYI